MPLTPEAKANTLKALRSGEYTREHGSIGSLKSKRLCCIGVAAASNGWTQPQRDPGTNAAAVHIGLTLEERDEWVIWNDIQELSFPQIADLIEAKY